jgi:hypothetical protein
MASRHRPQRSEEAQEYRRLYKTARWQRTRLQQLASEPLCRMCKAAGRVTAASVCDHVEQHKGDPVKFWNGPFQSLCDRCHSSLKQSQERTGKVKGVDENGWPLDPAHPWIKAKKK